MASASEKEFREPVMAALREWDVALAGIADLTGIETPRDEGGKPFPRAVSFAVLMDPAIMASIRTGPNDSYAEEYRRVNALIDEIALAVEGTIRTAGFRALTIPASDRTDPVNIRGAFPHKTAATRAGLGWIGRNCQLISRRHGPWLRLGTILTDLPASVDTAVIKHFCGACRKCVDACPANALAGTAWEPGMPRHELLDALRCDRWKKEHFFQFNQGHNCGICAAVCPFGK